MKCYLCGNEVSPRDKFCSKCGEKNVHYEGNPVENPTESQPRPEFTANYSAPVPKRSATSAKVVAIYSLVYGILSFLGSIGNDSGNFLNYVVAAVMIGFSIVILNLVKRGEYKEKGFLITLFVLYCLQAFVGFLILFIPIDMLGIPGLAELKFMVFFIVEAIIATPFIFSIRYMVLAGRGE